MSTETPAPIYYTPPAEGPIWPAVWPSHWPTHRPIRYRLTEKGKVAK
jgi:hypothetical protein